MQSALLSAERAEEIGLAARPHHPLGQGLGGAGPDRGLYRCSRARCDYALHLGLTEAGMGSKGIVASSAAHGRAAAAGHRRHHPHLADAGARRRPHARSEGGAGNAADHGLPRVRAAGRRLPRLRAHHLDHVPGAGPATSRISSATSMPEWKARYPGVETLNVAVMGCIVNGPGESQARRHRHLAARHRRGAGRAGVHRRQEGRDLARPRRRGRVQADGDRLYRAALRARRPEPTAAE